jgi:hypothetical protein
MTIKLAVEVEPVHETAKVVVARKREGEKEPLTVEFTTPTARRSQSIEVEVGDQLTVTIEAVGTIVYDKEQFSVHVEDLNAAEPKKRREDEKKVREKAEEDVKKDMELRAKEAQRIEGENVKKAKETEVSVANVPFPAPLPQEKAHNQTANSPSPPKGGAKDSKEVKV